MLHEGLICSILQNLSRMAKLAIMRARAVMNDEEIWTKEFLIHQGFKEEDITFEPNGPDTFPDFLVDGKNGKIGVETRRLNKYFQDSSGRKPIETLAKSIEIRMAKLLTSFGSSANGMSWYVDYDFKRPEITKDWEPIVCESLRAFQAGQVQVSKSVIEVDENFRIGLYRRELASGSIPGKEELFHSHGMYGF